MQAARLAPTVLAFAILAGCGSSPSGPSQTSTNKAPSCQPIYAALNLAPSEATKSDSEGRCLPQQLSFTGEVAGEVRVAEVTSLCTQPLGRGDAPPAPELQMIIGGKPYSFAILLSPGYDPARPSVAAGQKNGTAQLRVIDQTQRSNEFPWLATGGTVKFNPDGATGSVNADVIRNVQGAQPVHVSGTWRCGGPAASPSPAPGPCGAVAASRVSNRWTSPA